MRLPHNSWQATSVSCGGTLLYKRLVLNGLKGYANADVQVELTESLEKAIYLFCSIPTAKVSLQRVVT